MHDTSTTNGTVAAATLAPDEETVPVAGVGWFALSVFGLLGLVRRQPRLRQR